MCETTVKIDHFEAYCELLGTIEELKAKEGNEELIKSLSLSLVAFKDLMVDAMYDLDTYRQCDTCGVLFGEGYCIEGGVNYFCSKECLEKDMTWEEFLELYDDGEGDSYWTQWEG